jgi:hypothetical protein
MVSSNEETHLVVFPPYQQPKQFVWNHSYDIVIQLDLFQLSILWYVFKNFPL